MSSSPLQRLFRELKRRNVFRVGGVYAVVAWVLIEVADTVAPLMAMPPWAPKIVVFLALFGFPVALVLAWALEITPEGVKRTEPATPSSFSSRSGAYAGAGLLLILAGFGAYSYWDAPPEEVLPREHSIAVLPFDNLSADEENAFFAAGVHEEVLTQLSKIGDLKVISRTSVLTYADSDETLPVIARALDVRTILEGSVARYGDRIRVTAQLIEAATDEHLWAESYDRTVDDIFGIQSEIALAITDALQANLAPEEKARIESRPTESTEAYSYYLQALDYWRGPDAFEEQSVRTSEGLFRRATEVDPDFALAHARLSMAHSLLYWMRWDRNEERLERARETAERALRAQPSLPEGHLALGTYHYWGHRDYKHALDELRIALRGLPNSTDVHEMLGNVYRRQGRWEEATLAYERATELDPRNIVALATLAQTYGLTYRYAEALEVFDRVLTLAPEANRYRFEKAVIRYRGMGEVSALPDAADRLPEHSFAGQVGHARAWSRYRARDFQGMIEAVEESGREVFEESIVVAAEPASLKLGYAYHHLGDSARAREQFDAARIFYEERLRENPEDEMVHAELGAVYAHLGRRDEALRHGRRAVELLPPSRDAFSGPWTVQSLARTHAILGDREESIAQLERIAGRPAGPTSHVLRINPDWDPLRDDPRFQRLLERARP